MRRVVVLPHPDGPSNVVKLAAGISSETSSPAAAAPNRLLTWTSRTCPSSIGNRAKTDSATAQPPDADQDDRRHADDGGGERGSAAPVEVVDELKNGDGGYGGARREQEDHHREGGDS